MNALCSCNVVYVLKSDGRSAVGDFSHRTEAEPSVQFLWQGVTWSKLWSSLTGEQLG